MNGATERAATISPALRHLVSWRLPGGPAEPLGLDSADRIDGASSSALVAETRFHRVTGVVLAALDDGATTSVPAGLRDALRSEHSVLLHQTLMAEADLVQVARQLALHRLDIRVLKGLATAHLDHSDPALRMTSDVDVLVRPDELGAATAALSAHIDLDASVPDRNVTYVERYGKDRTLKLHSGGWLDLHRMLVPSYWGMSMAPERFFEHGQSFHVANTELTALAPIDRLLHAVLHAGATDDVKAHSLRDALVLLHALDGNKLIADRSLRPVHGLLAVGLRRIDALFDAEVPLLPWAEAMTPTWRERLALRTHSLEGSRDHWSGPLALPPQRWPGYLWPILNPSAEYRRWYRRSRRSHARSAWTAVTRRHRHQ